MGGVEQLLIKEAHSIGTVFKEQMSTIPVHVLACVLLAVSSCLYYHCSKCLTLSIIDGTCHLWMAYGYLGNQAFYGWSDSSTGRWTCQGPIRAASGPYHWMAKFKSRPHSADSHSMDESYTVRSHSSLPCIRCLMHCVQCARQSRFRRKWGPSHVLCPSSRWRTRRLTSCGCWPCVIHDLGAAILFFVLLFQSIILDTIVYCTRILSS